MLCVLFFGDLLLQIALGPLLPLLFIGVLHMVIYLLAWLLSVQSLRWNIGGVYLREAVLYFLYPVFVCIVAVSVAYIMR